MFQCTMQWKNMFARIRVLVEVGKTQHAGFIPVSGAGWEKRSISPHGTEYDSYEDYILNEIV